MSRGRWFLPHDPDVLGVLIRQLAVTTEGMEAFARWAGGDETAALAVRDCEHRADVVRRELHVALRAAFVTPLEPEDLYALSRGCDEVLNQAKDAVRESEVMACQPDEAFVEMAGYLEEATRRLAEGIGSLGRRSELASEAADAAVKCDRHLEHVVPRRDGRAARDRRSARGDRAPRALPPLLAHRRDRRRRRRADPVRGGQGELTRRPLPLGHRGWTPIRVKRPLERRCAASVSYTHLTLPTTPYV